MRNYLIIGASSGIGRRLAELLSQEGDSIFATYNKNPVQDENMKYMYLDVMQEPLELDVPDRIDGIAYCPGSIRLVPFHRIKPADFIEDYRLQVLGAVKVIQQVLPNIKKSASASIVLFSTVAVQMGYGFHSLVSSSKGAIEGLGKALAAELAPSIRVNVIAPSIVDTPLAGRLLSTDEKKEASAHRHPLKKIGTTDDIAQMAKFLLTDDSAWITGQVLHVDGGISTIKS